MKVSWILSCLVVAASAGWHNKLDPLASKIKAAEDRIFAELPEMEPKIVGGEVARKRSHPYLVGLIVYRVGEVTICGSSLVSPTLLVTAAHCVSDVLTVEAILGSQYLFYEGTRVMTTDFVAHPKYNISVSLDYDIGVVILPAPVEFTDDVKPISLPQTPDETEFIGEWAETFGWGYISDNNSYVNTDTVVYRVRLRIIAAKECTSSYSHIDAKENIVCTSGLEGVGTCGGDSGGPLIVTRNARKILVGLTSFGHVKCEIQKPSVFTRVASYLDFIQRYL